MRWARGSCGSENRCGGRVAVMWGKMLKRYGRQGRQTDLMGDTRDQLDRAVRSYQASPMPLFPSTELGSLADLLGEDEPRRGGGVVCPCCRSTTRRVVRVRPGGASRWIAVCAMCAGKLLAGHPATVVGGRVRPRLRRAG